MTININEDFWDCECLYGYIKPKSQTCCDTCGSIQEDMPDSRAIEVIQQELIKE